MVYDHIRWQRLPHIEHSRRRRPNAVLPPVPLAEDRAGHGRDLATSMDQAHQAQTRARDGGGISPERLAVLEFTFLEVHERQFLERLGASVLSERDRTTSLDTPEYEVPVRFGDRAALAAVAAPGLVTTRPVRGQNGDPSPDRLTLVFGDAESASAFLRDELLQREFGITSCGARRAVHLISRNEALVELPDADTFQRLERELSAYAASDTTRVELTHVQRTKLFDGLVSVRRPERDDRTGPRLRLEPPTAESFYLDVDLWHPGSPALLAEALQQFREFVVHTDGEVTDPPHTVAGALLIGRIRGSQRTLDALLDYDRVACVDLPPVVKLTLPLPSLDVDAPVELPALSADGPLACVVDSGVVAGHPLLAGTVVDERDFNSGEMTVADTIGHGTQVAGAIVYGDVSACSETDNWVPKVRLLSAKILRPIDRGDGECLAGFSDALRAETQIRTAIETFVEEYGCRVFNLSIGNPLVLARGGRQLPWAYVLDELAVTNDIVIVVPTGNVSDPQVPDAPTEQAFQAAIVQRLLSTDHALSDPAPAANALTVGGIARHDVPAIEVGRPGRRELVASPAGGPSPFTRTGVIGTSGSAAISRSVKPDVAAYAGNYRVNVGMWHRADLALSEPCLKHDYQGTRLLTLTTGTSIAAPYVAHVCALIEERIRSSFGQEPTANLVRALAVHSARPSPAVETWLDSAGLTDQTDLNRLRLVGYGLPDPSLALSSHDGYVVLVAEDQLPADGYHLYEIDLPEEFGSGSGPRRVRVTLAYDPVVRATRQEYLSRTMSFRLYRGLSAETIADAMARNGDIPPANQPDLDPPESHLEWSTVQSRVYQAQRQRAFSEYTVNGTMRWHVLVQCKTRMEMEGPSQRYALVLSLEDEREGVRLYQTVRENVAQRVRIRPAG